MRGYTFRMKFLLWVTLIAAAAGFAYWLRSWRRRRAQRQRASDERLAALMAELQDRKRTKP
jgi:hypothetical protein